MGGERYSMTIKYLDSKRIRGSSTADAPLGDGLKAYWKFDGSSTSTVVNVASTITGNSTLGTNANINLINAPTPSVTGTPTNLETAYTFNGTDELGEVGSQGNRAQWNFMHSSVSGVPSVFTFNVWLKFPSGTQPVNNKFLWDDSQGTDTQASFQIRGKGGFWRVILANGVPTSGGVVFSSDDDPQLDVPQDQEWHMYTFTWDHANTPNFTYRVDAATSGTYFESENKSGTEDSNTGQEEPYIFANQSASNDVGSWQAGTICELAIWNRVLTSAEITTLYASGGGLQLDIGLPVWKEKGTA